MVRWFSGDGEKKVVADSVLMVRRRWWDDSVALMVRRRRWWFSLVECAPIKQQHCSSQPTTHNHHDMSVLLLICDSESKLCIIDFPLDVVRVSCQRTVVTIYLWNDEWTTHWKCNVCNVLWWQESVPSPQIQTWFKCAQYVLFLLVNAINQTTCLKWTCGMINVVGLLLFALCAHTYLVLCVWWGAALRLSQPTGTPHAVIQ